jgi:phosphohistidine phosphatase
MRVCLVHHADAVAPSVDPQRPLSTAGQAHATQLATRVQATGFAPAAIWHSGKLRSRQTAEAFLRVYPFSAFQMVRGLRPEDPPNWLRDELNAESRDILLVGHMPHLPGLARMLVPGASEAQEGAFPLHGVIVFERIDGQGWRELARVT